MLYALSEPLSRTQKRRYEDTSDCLRHLKLGVLRLIAKHNTKSHLLRQRWKVYFAGARTNVIKPCAKQYGSWVKITNYSLDHMHVQENFHARLT